jgi:pyruvate dehydrogenase E2 component (dihydrolipoamide acetyltransferase)
VKLVRVPTLSANVEEATVGGWCKAEGDSVKKGEALVELITDKAAFELESSASGIVRKILATEKSVLPVGYVLALIGGKDEKLLDVERANAKLMEAMQQRVATAEPDGQVRRAAGKKRVRATPAARRLAREHGVNISDVWAASKSDSVSADDVRAYVEGSS